MNLSTKTVLTALILAVAACAGTDTNKTGPDVTDLTATEYTLPASASVQVAPNAPSLAVGTTVKLATNLIDANGNRLKGIVALLAQWRSSDTTIAIVSATGLVKGLRDGTATITAISGRQVASSVVTVGNGGHVPVSQKPDSIPATTTPATTTPATTTPATTTSPTTPAPSTTPATAPKATSTPPVATTPPVAATPLPVTTPPSAPSAPTVVSASGPGLSGLAVISDDFTEYSSTSSLMARITANNPGGTGPTQGSFYGDGINASLASIDQSVQYNGHPTLKLSQPGGVESTPWLAVSLPSPLVHIWYRVKIRFSPGFSTTGTLSNSANAYKMLSWQWGGGLNGSGRLEISNTTQYQLYENVQSAASLVGGGGYMMAGNISTEWTDGGWYDYIIEVDHSQATGMIRLWRSKDGQTPVYQGQMAEKMNDGSMMPALTGVTVGLNFNQVRAASQNQAVWWGQWEVVDGTQHPNPFGVSPAI